MPERDDYPAGVPCWIDLVQPDLDATMAFYAGLFGWTFEMRTPEGAPARYAYARLDGATVGGVGTPAPAEANQGNWTHYVSVESVDDTATAVASSGGRILTPPTDIPRSGRVALCADPEGAAFGLWQPSELHGAQAVNAAGSWNFSELHTGDPAGAERFYGAVFGWTLSSFAVGDGQTAGFWRLAGYGDFLAERDPEIRDRQRAGQAPEGFADAVAVLQPLGSEERGGEARWTVTFAVADAAAATSRAVELGATVVTPLFDAPYTRMSVVRDPQGAELTLSEYRPPAGA